MVGKRSAAGPDTNRPGPGAYNFETPPRRGGAGFGTGPARGAESTQNQTPGVGAYTPVDPTIVSARGAPISGRHPQHSSAVETPGPGTYGLPPTWQNGPKVSMARKYNSEKGERGRS